MWKVFSNKLGNFIITSLHIDTGDTAPVAKRPYRNPMSARAGFLKQLDEWDEEGIIRRSKSAWAAPVLLVPKKDGTWRTVVDYRGLNKLLKREHNPVPLISEVMDTMGGAQFFSTMDLTSGNYQLPVAEEDAHKTAFTTPFGLYEHLKIPMGISSEVPCFQRTMELILRGLVGGVSFLVYFDDIICYCHIRSAPQKKNLNSIQGGADKRQQHEPKGPPILHSLLNKNEATATFRTQLLT
jgi:hypothetical protein